MPLRHVAVVGASHAGVRAAETMRREGFDGRLTVVGAEPHRPYQRPPLSKQLLTGGLDEDRIGLRLDEDLDYDLRLGVRARQLRLNDRSLVLTGPDGDEELRVDGVVIATGATPRTLPGGDALGGVFTLRTLDDAQRLRAALQDGPRVVIVGAGVLGCELAASCRSQGLDVTVVDVLDAPMQQAFGPQLADVCTGLHRDNGTRLRLGAGVEKLLGNGQVTGVRLDSGETLEADVVIVGVGVTPETGWLQGSGLTIDDGVVCDETCAAVGVDNVVAAGDVARWHHPREGRRLRVEHWNNASAQASVAARTLLGTRTRPYDDVPFFWSDQYGVKFQMLGIPRPDDEFCIVEGTADERKFVGAYGRGGTTSAVLAANSQRRVFRYKPLLEAGASFPPEPPG